MAKDEQREATKVEEEGGGAAVKEAAAKTSSTNDKESSTDDREAKAAGLIQRNYRGYKTRRELQGMGLDPTARWGEALHHMKLDDAREQQLGKKQGGGESERREAKDCSGT